ncbi:phosphatase PAP2 family protein [bacterium]|nr:phosphatase PAP2 family protein [bacterium]
MKLKTFSRALFALLIILWAFPAYADSSAASVVSDLTGPLILAGELSLYYSGTNGRQEAVDGAKALFATAAITELLKHTVHEKRLESNEDDSFPSAHTAVVFAMATTLADYQPDIKWAAYGTASAIGWSRVEEREHRWRDVIAGALIGHYVARHFTGSHVAITPGGLAYQTVW